MTASVEARRIALINLATRANQESGPVIMRALKEFAPDIKDQALRIQVFVELVDSLRILEDLANNPAATVAVHMPGVFTNTRTKVGVEQAAAQLRLIADAALDSTLRQLTTGATS